MAENVGARLGGVSGSVTFLLTMADGRPVCNFLFKKRRPASGRGQRKRPGSDQEAGEGWEPSVAGPRSNGIGSLGWDLDLSSDGKGSANCCVPCRLHGDGVGRDVGGAAR